MTLQDQVKEFMTSFNQNIREKPGVPDDDVVRLRARLVVEEVFEMLEAMFELDTTDVREYVEFDIKHSNVAVNLPELADAFADIAYVVEGAAISSGINMAPIADVVHASNMAKIGGYRDENGKWRKPAGWQAPDIAGELVKQGWAGTDGN